MPSSVQLSKCNGRCTNVTISRMALMFLHSQDTCQGCTDPYNNMAALLLIVVPSTCSLSSFISAFSGIDDTMGLVVHLLFELRSCWPGCRSPSAS
eukprot:1814448-Amphidinium_carterae.2